ncbi:unnamed protein product, partial [marine sediment metagenome]
MLLCIYMVVRKDPLVNDHYYHLFNRSVAKETIFIDGADLYRGIELLNYYHFIVPPFPYSQFKKRSQETQRKILDNLKQKEKLVEIICYCLMPNHFHLLLKQLVVDGISNFLRKFQDSYAKYLNKRYERFGSAFQNPFKSVLVENDNQLLHLSRYIHLNPYTSLIAKNKDELMNYPWSSLGEYRLEEKTGFCRPKIILDQFKDRREYLKFVLDNADYQRSLKRIEHLFCERVNLPTLSVGEVRRL